MVKHLKQQNKLQTNTLIGLFKMIDMKEILELLLYTFLGIGIFICLILFNDIISIFLTK